MSGITQLNDLSWEQQIRGCRQGLQIDLGFFSDLHVPDYHCPEDYWFHSQDGLWAWKYDGNDLFLDLKDDIRYASCPARCCRSGHSTAGSHITWAASLLRC